jgi:hypothetical protein
VRLRATAYRAPWQGSRLPSGTVKGRSDGACPSRPCAGASGKPGATGIPTSSLKVPVNWRNSSSKGDHFINCEPARRCTRFVPESSARRCRRRRNPCKQAKAVARTRTGDPFITRERQVGDARPRAGTCGHVLAGNWAVLELLRRTRVPAQARAHVPVSYPLCVVIP